MSRVIGIDPGTVTIDLCGLDDGRVFLGRTLATADVLRTPEAIVGIVEAATADLIAGPSGYGLPLVAARTASEEDLSLAYLMPEGAAGGIGGLRTLIRALARVSAPVLLTPGVIHLASVPAFRKINRVDMGTADKVCSVVLAIDEQMRMRACRATEVSLILLELGGAFSAAMAVDGGQIVDGVGGSAGPMGARAAGALDGEVAFLLGTVTKDMLFQGGASTIAGVDATPWPEADTPNARLAMAAYLDGLLKAVAAMAVAVPRPHEIVVSGRFAFDLAVRGSLAARLGERYPATPVRLLRGFATSASQAAQGAALLADGLSGGRAAGLVAAMGIREASGTVLDHLHVISRDAARQRLGLGR